LFDFRSVKLAKLLWDKQEITILLGKILDSFVDSKL